MMKLTISDIKQILQSEIKWCEGNMVGDTEKKFADGFIGGLKQAEYLIIMAETEELKK